MVRSESNGLKSLLGVESPIADPSPPALARSTHRMVAVPTWRPEAVVRQTLSTVRFGPTSSKTDHMEPKEPCQAVGQDNVTHSMSPYDPDLSLDLVTLRAPWSGGQGHPENVANDGTRHEARRKDQDSDQEKAPHTRRVQPEAGPRNARLRACGGLSMVKRAVSRDFDMTQTPLPPRPGLVPTSCADMAAGPGQAGQPSTDAHT